jgi:cobalt-zinc-cadmium efflux system membrane fusion protein
MKNFNVLQFLGAAMSCTILLSANAYAAGDHDHDDEHAEEARGPHGGRLLSDGDFAIELTVFESGIPPEFRIYAYHDEAALAPEDFDVNVTLTRLGGEQDRFEFVAEQDYRRGEGLVREPHSFDVEVLARHEGKPFDWAYENHEGRTEIPARVAETAGIAVAAAGPVRIVESISLTGTVQAIPANIAEVRTRFPGIVRQVRRDIGDAVQRGAVLARIESNESLRTFSLAAPIDGLIVDRDVQPGQVTGTEPLFVIANLNQIWVQLDVFGRDLPRVAKGQPVEIATLDGDTYPGEIDWISPMVSHGSQSVRARVVLDNATGQFRPGQFVRATVVVSAIDVPLAVQRNGLQTFRDFDVVFARIGNTYEVRMLELGRSDATHIEVLGGISRDEVYVTDNSYLIKADIEKSGASHDH